MSQPAAFTVASFSAEGKHLNSNNVNTSDLDQEIVGYFSNKFQRLSGDLELPFEDKLPGGIDFIEYRIGSDLNGAYVLYYFHDEVIFASLLLSGRDDVQETELMQVFKFLLLDTQNSDEPTEDEIEAILASKEFDFEAIDERPISYQVELVGDDSIEVECNHIQKMDQALAVAFFERSSTQPDPDTE